MLKIDIWPVARDFIDTLPAKHQRQIGARIGVLRENPEPPRSKLLEGFAPLRRVRSGDYRIVYFANTTTLNIVLVDRRNDDAVYRRLKQMFQ